MLPRRPTRIYIVNGYGMVSKKLEQKSVRVMNIANVTEEYGERADMRTGKVRTNKDEGIIGQVASIGQLFADGTEAEKLVFNACGDGSRLQMLHRFAYS